jgi:hypothetical protein
MVKRVFGPAAVVVVTAALLFPSLASAKAGDKSFTQTYPYASALCAKVAAGHTPPKLKGSEAKVGQACATLQNAFGPLQAAVQGANAQLQSGVASERAKIKQACLQGAVRANCRAARRNGRLVIASLRRQHRAAVRLYYTSIEANRRTFWATIRALRGGASITPDRPITPQSS